MLVCAQRKYCLFLIKYLIEKIFKCMRTEDYYFVTIMKKSEYHCEELFYGEVTQNNQIRDCNTLFLITNNKKFNQIFPSIPFLPKV